MLTLDELKGLAAISGPCLTIFQPLRDNYSHVAKPVTRITAAIQDAARLLARRGLTAAESDEMLRPLLKVAVNTNWEGRKGSVILFRAPGTTLANFWPDTLPGRVHFGREFLVVPLLPALLSSRNFWLLSLSINVVRLYRGSRKGMLEVPLPRGVPTNLKDAGAFEQPDHTRRGRSSAGPSVGNMKGVQFDMPSPHETQAAYLHDFFKMIDRGIHAMLMKDRQPLILAGVTRELAIYRKVNTYSPVLSGAVQGSPDGLAPEALAGHFYEHAKELISEYPGKPAAEVRQEVESAANRGLLVVDARAVLHAALTGRAYQLIICPGTLGFRRQEDLINRAVLAAIRHSGKIAIVPAADTEHAAILPEGSGAIAAVLRFRPEGQTSSREMYRAASP